jgi:hypothetical protein
MKDYYYILGLSRDASKVEIQKAYKKLSLKFHPDINNNDKFFEERFKEILEAYQTLSDEKKKIEYDAKLKNFQSKATSSSSQQTNQNANGNNTSNKTQTNQSKSEHSNNTTSHSNQKNNSDSKLSKESSDEVGIRYALIGVGIVLGIVFIMMGIGNSLNNDNKTANNDNSTATHLTTVDSTATDNEKNIIYDKCVDQVQTYVSLVNQRNYTNLASYFSPVIKYFYGNKYLSPIDVVFKLKASMENEPNDSYYKVSDFNVNSNKEGYIVYCSQVERILQADRLPYILYTKQCYKLDDNLRIYSLHGVLEFKKPDIARFLNYGLDKKDSDFITNASSLSFDTIFSKANNITDSITQQFYKKAVIGLFGSSLRIGIRINDNDSYLPVDYFLDSLLNKSYHFVKTEEVLKDNSTLLGVSVICENAPQYNYPPHNYE